MDLRSLLAMNDNNVKDEINYRELLHTYLISKWYWYVLGLAMCLGLAYVYAGTIPPAYAIKSKILLKEDRDNYDPNDWLKHNLNQANTSENVNNEIQILSSYSLMYSVVKDLDLDINYFWKDDRRTRSAFIDSPVSIDTFSLSRSSLYGLTLMIKPVGECDFALYKEDTLLGEYSYDSLFVNEYGTFEVNLSGQEYYESHGDLCVQFLDAAALAQGYVSSLDIQLIDLNSSTLEIYTEDEVPDRGIAVLNTLLENYSLVSTRDNDELTQNTLSFLDERLLDVADELKKAEYNLESYKRSNNIAGETNSDLSLVLEKASQLSGEAQNYKLQLSILKSVKNDLDAGQGSYNLIPANVAAINSQLSSLIQPYNTLVLERRHILESAQASHPSVVAATQKLNQLKSSIVSTIDNLERDFELKLEMVNEQYAGTSGRLQRVPSNERRVLQIQRDKSIVEDLYVYMLKKREETALSMVSTPSRIAVIDPPYSSVEPVSPNKKIIYFGGILGGLGIPFMLILTMGLFNTTLKSEEEIKQLLPGQKIMGRINQANVKDKKQIVVSRNSRTWISERFRSLRTNLQLNAGNSIQSIMVTSSISAEGKTFIALNLATSFALARKKTILLDFDMRNPKLSKNLGDNSEDGLSNYFYDYQRIEDIIKESKIHSNLQYIPSGPIPPNPTELISDLKLDILFNYLYENYDIIIIDTPPLGIVTDAILLNSYLTHTLYVVRPGYTRKDVLESCCEIFEEKKLVNPSIIINGVSKAQSYSRHYYKYYSNQSN